ncbi:hypothetical protein [Psychrobacter lutiphocae]|uniref:hypothetical protein n=1 Tax=Psychrobacter lutiphocae TaxID=540500 RepID=UPI00191953FD|nr:hypothetical protein [Psychrobacter lutiphocae]
MIISIQQIRSFNKAATKQDAGDVAIPLVDVVDPSAGKDTLLCNLDAALMVMCHKRCQRRWLRRCDSQSDQD